MRYIYGAIFWIFGGAILAGGLASFGVWLGWALLAGGVMLFMPPLWRIESRRTPLGRGYLLRAPFVASGVLFLVLALVLAGSMGAVVVEGAAAEALGYGFLSLLTFAAAGSLLLPLFRHAQTLEHERSPRELPINVFEVAQARGGRLTAAELAANFGVGYERARHALQALVDDGACDTLVTRSGAVVYRFPELEGDKLDLLEP